MKTKIFQSGKRQTVRILKEFRFDSIVVKTFKPDDEVVIKPIPENLGKAFELFTEMPGDLRLMDTVMTNLKAETVFNYVQTGHQYLEVVAR